MKVRFWGTRGSLPASISSEAIRKKIIRALGASKGLIFSDDEGIETFLNEALARGDIPFSAVGTYGVNTSCIEVEGGNEYVICDAGTGIRDLGNHLLSRGPGDPKSNTSVYNIFMSHLHWDHIQGFPFFVPAYQEGNRINIFGLHEELERAFVSQQEYPFFPVPLSAMNARITFTVLEAEREYDIAGFRVRAKRQSHPGTSWGYRFEKDGKAIVYSTDSEHKGELGRDDRSFFPFFKDADLLIFEAQYPLLDAISSKENWGHSSNIMAVEFSVEAKVKRLCIFHNEPTFDDETLDKFLDDTRRYLRIYEESSSLVIDLAYDGLVIEV